MNRSKIIHQSLLFVGVGAWVFFFLSLASFHPTDWPSHEVYPYPPIQNLCGPTGAYIAYYSFLVLGEGWFPLLFLTGVGLAMVLFKFPVRDLWLRVIGLVILSVAFAAVVHYLHPGSPGALPEGHGGIVGIGASTWLQNRFHAVGTTIVLSTLMLVGLLLAADELVLHAPGMVGQAITKVQATVPWKNWKIRPVTKLPSLPKFVTKETPKPAKSRKAIVKVVELEDEVEDAEEEEKVVEPPPAPIAPPVVRKDIIVRLPSNMKPKQIAPPVQPKELGEYHLPAWDCLDEAEYGFAATQEGFVRQMAAILEKALQEFNIDAHVVEIDTGPVITVYELALAPGVKVSTISALTNDIQRSLKAETIRIVAPIPGKNTVGIEVPNAQKEKVRLKELMQQVPDALNKMAIPLFLGKDSSGSPMVDDLTRMPHLLIAGTTGSGKSVCINSIIMSIMYRQRPDMVKLILIDPKVVEMASFKEIPHLMCPIINESSRACSVLEWACEKMDERYEFLAEAGVRNIKGYNSLTTKELVERFNPATPEEEARIPKRLPFIVIIVDELADLMMTSGKEVESHIVRLAQKARAVGIHLILATQRPQATVVTGLIKANMPAKIAFRVSSKMDSRIVLDMNGAEVLLGQGDMLYLPAGASKPIRSQGTFIDDKEMRESVKLIRDAAEQQFEPELVQIKAAGNIDEGAAKDELFDQAVRIVLETKRGSVSLLQRRLTIGYSRASRLIEAMAGAGIVGDYKGSQAREALYTVEEWDAMQQQAQADAQSGMTV